jgi:hypothetical protein
MKFDTQHGREMIILLLPGVQTVPEAHRASFSILALSFEIKRPEREADHLPVSGSEDNSVWSSIRLHDVVVY